MSRHGLLQWTLRRLLIAVPVVIGVTALAFTLIHLAPGDPIYLLAGDGGSPAYYAEMRAKYGLDRPLVEQFVRYARAVLTLDLGYSFLYQARVSSVLRDHLPASLLLGSVALAIATLGGFVIGTLAAVWPSRTFDRTARAVASVMYAAPVFWTGQMLILVFAVKTHWFPVAGMTSACDVHSGFAYAVDLAWHLTLPAIALSLTFLAVVIRVSRASVLETMREPFVGAAAARGLRAIHVLRRHVIRHSWMPLVALVGQHATGLVTGAALTETLFGWPGLGFLVFHASIHRDYPLVTGAFVLISAGVVLLNALTDAIGAWLDPRIRLV